MKKKVKRAVGASKFLPDERSSREEISAGSIKVREHVLGDETLRTMLDSVFDSAETPGAVDAYVHYLRRKLGKQVVRTVHRTGYRFGLE